jgi:hypothetical protein
MAILDGQNTSLTFNGVLVGRVTRYEIIDGVTPDIKHAPLSKKTNFFLPGVAEFGSINLTMYRDLADLGQIEMEIARAGSKKRTCVLTLSDGSTRTFPGYVKKLPIVGDDNGVGTASAVIKVAGSVT